MIVLTFLANAVGKLFFQTAIKKRKSALSTKNVTQSMQPTSAQYQSQVHFQENLKNPTSTNNESRKKSWT